MPDENKKPAIAPNDSANSSDKGQGNTQKQTQQNQQGQQTQDSSAQETQTPDATDVQQEINQAAQSTTGEQGVSQNTNQGKTKTTSDQKSKTPRPVVEETSAPPTPQQEGNQTAPPQPPSLGNQNENDQAQKSSNSPSGPDQTPTIDSSASEAPPPPPQDGDVSGAPPPPPASDGSSSSPPGNIPPVVTPQKSKKKFGGKKVIATILGLLLLVGGIGAGVILVQQQQDIRERAAIQNGGDGGGSDEIPGDPAPQPAPPDCQGDFDCRADQECIRGECVVKETPQPTAPPQECFSNVDCLSSEVCDSGVCVEEDSGTNQCTRLSRDDLIVSDTNSNSITITGAMLSKCREVCPAGSEGGAGSLYVSQYECDGIGLSGGCNDNGAIVSNNPSIGDEFSMPSPSCGTIQIDVGCKNEAGTYGNVAFVSQSASQACTTTSGNGGGGLSAQCLNIQAYDTDWNILTQDDLASLQPGDTVRFTVAGSTTSGSFDRARFMVNGQRRPDVTQKRPGTQEFYDEITIPENTTQFSINAQLHHSSAGWF